MLEQYQDNVSSDEVAVSLEVDPSFLPLEPTFRDF